MLTLAKLMGLGWVKLSGGKSVLGCDAIKGEFMGLWK
jgi:hypothetical protein